MRTELFDGTLQIRRYETADIPLLFEAARESVPEASRWLPWLHAGYSMEESLEWVNDSRKQWEIGQEYSFAIIDPMTHLFMGGVGLNQINAMHRIANLGYWVRSSCTGRGVATAATRLVSQFGFQDLKLQRLEILVEVGNVASQRVAEKAGAHREGILRKRFCIHGNPADAIVYSLVMDG
ncbi:MAG: GNAT family N-acetyltransferase [Terriglobia bacterium]